MTSALCGDRTSIARVRVHTARRDALQVSQRAGALLERLDLRPPGLPFAAILLIRELRDPLPRSVALTRHEGAAPARWKEAVSTKIAQLAREAARPASGPVPSGASVVLFADEAELVACLVRDWLRGRVGDRWWWRSVLGDLSPQQWLRRHVLSRGEVLVPAIAVLAESPDAAAWLARLDDSEAKEATTVIARTHAVSLTVEEDEPPARLPSAHSDERGHAGNELDVEADSRSPALERLIATVPEVLTPTLRPPQRRLVALALALSRAPSWSRTGQLALALRALDQAVLVTGAPALVNSAARQSEIPKRREPRAETATKAPSIVNTPAHHVGVPQSTDSVDASPQALGESPAAAQLPSSSAHIETRDAPQVPRQDVAPDAPPVVTQTVVGDAPATHTETPPVSLSTKIDLQKIPSIEEALRVRTRFGGIFYLLNAALAMKLYADFTSPRGANLKISPWDWLALVGRSWFGRGFVRDPVWNLLAGLAGRERRSLRRRRWLKTQIEKLHARLALALGEEMSADIPALVCGYPAEIAATASRVDVHLALSDLPLAIRVAGLDRDPGWIPAAGRTIAFHFE